MTQTELEQAKLAIGSRLRAARKAKGITQERLALALDVDPAWIQWGDRFAGMRVE